MKKSHPINPSNGGKEKRNTLKEIQASFTPPNVYIKKNSPYTKRKNDTKSWKIYYFSFTLTTGGNIYTNQYNYADIIAEDKTPTHIPNI
jgi:hypothetical protein